MKNNYEIAIIGGGITGLSAAFELTKKGIKDIVILEKNYLGSGSSGKCGGGIRQQFSTVEHITLMRESVKMWENLKEELDYEIHYKQGGYLFLLTSDAQIEQFKKNIELQNSLGVPSKLVEPYDAKQIVSELNENAFLKASYCKTDGTVFPFDVITGYFKALKRKGVGLLTDTEVFDIKRENNCVKSLITNRGEIQTKIIINASGYGSLKIAKMIGVDLPYRLDKHQIMVTESLKDFLAPLVVYETLYFSQSYKGNIVGGTDTDDKDTKDLNVSSYFLNKFSKEILQVMPKLSDIKLLRSWAGYYVVSPDAHPVIGKVDLEENFYEASGYSGHGFMMGPIVGRLLAELIVDKKTSIDIEPLNLRRFNEGRLLFEKAVIG